MIYSDNIQEKNLSGPFLTRMIFFRAVIPFRDEVCSEKIFMITLELTMSN